jgi:hypothetical protein
MGAGQDGAGGGGKQQAERAAALARVIEAVSHDGLYG